MAYTLYIGNKNYSSWSLRGWLLVRATGVPFDEKLVSLNVNEQSGAYQQFSPSGLVPCLVADATSPGTTVWDTSAIAEYLAERHRGLWPAVFCSIGTPKPRFSNGVAGRVNSLIFGG